MSDASKIELSKKGLPTKKTTNANPVVNPNSADNVRGNSKPNAKSNTIDPNGNTANSANGSVVRNDIKSPTGNTKPATIGGNSV